MKNLILFDEIKKLINSKQIITRQDLINKKAYFSPNTIDMYRIALTAAGFLKTISRGKYKVKYKIPAYMNTSILVNLAYGHKINFNIIDI